MDPSQQERVRQIIERIKIISMTEAHVALTMAKLVLQPKR